VKSDWLDLVPAQNAVIYIKLLLGNTFYRPSLETYRTALRKSSFKLFIGSVTPCANFDDTSKYFIFRMRAAV